MRVAVIGAGVSGLLTARYLGDEGVTPVVFERSHHLGGVWVFHEDRPDGGGPAYRSLRTNTSRQVTALSDFPFSPDLPEFPHRSAVLAYLESYARRSALRDTIRFDRDVTHVQQADPGGWRVTTRSGAYERTDCFDAVVVCSGIHWNPLLPPIPGLDSYTGQMLHSMQYVDARPFDGQEVLVVGTGSSAADIATEVSVRAQQVMLSARAGVWIVPRCLGGRPFDHANTRFARALPPRLRDRLVRQRLLRQYRRMGLGHPTGMWGLDEPALTRLTTSSELLPRIRSDSIQIRPGIAHVDGAEVLFTNGVRSRPDAIVFCTGYTRRFPFLGQYVAVAPDGSVDLYKHVFHPSLHNLAFVGMCRVQGSVFPIAELQARWVARVLTGQADLPPEALMRHDIEARRLRQRKAGLPVMRVPFLDYADEIADEIGARPHLWRHPRVFLPLLLGPATAADYRLE
ncbi:MAG: NAD(P)-binding domain-containing protein [Chloroflexota bacterium]